MSHKASIQEILHEELMLLPGRISRCFFLIAAIEAQAYQISDDIKILRQCAIAQYARKTLQSNECPVNSSHPAALQKLYQVQQKLLSDKLCVQKKAFEWYQRAQQLVEQYNNELQSLQKPAHTRYTELSQLCRKLKFSDSSEGDRQHNFKLEQSLEASRLGRQLSRAQRAHTKCADNSKKRKSGTTEDCKCLPQLTNLEVISDDLFETPASSALWQESASAPKQAFALAGGTSNKIPQSSQQSSRLSLKPGVSTPKIENVIIKLGYQKGRPRKTSTKLANSGGLYGSSKVPSFDETLSSEQASPNRAVLDSVIYDTDENICPICRCSENSNPSMVACDTCDLWYHCVCVGFIDEADAASKAFICSRCQSLHMS